MKEDGTHMYLWLLIHVDVWRKPTQHCKGITFHLKINTILKIGCVTMFYEQAHSAEQSFV